MSLLKQARPDHPIHELFVKRWSPCAFSDQPVPEEDLRALFEAARWSASNFNEQPWRYIVATRKNPEEFERLAGEVQGFRPEAPTTKVGVRVCFWQPVGNNVRHCEIITGPGRHSFLNVHMYKKANIYFC